MSSVPSGAATTASPPTASPHRITWSVVVGFLSNKFRNRGLRHGNIRRKRLRGKRSRRIKLRGNKLELLGIVVAVIVLCLTIAALAIQIDGNSLTRKGNSLAQTGNEYTAKGTAIAESSCKLQAYGECRDRAVSIKSFTVLKLTQPDELHRSFEILRCAEWPTTASGTKQIAGYRAVGSVQCHVLIS